MTCMILWSSPPKTRNMSNVHSLHDFKNMHFHGFYLLTMNHPSWILPCLSDIQFVKNICDWLTEWLTDWLTEWLTDWVTCPILERLAPLKIKFEDNLKMKTTWTIRMIEDDLKKKMLYSRRSLALAYMTLVVIIFTSFVANSWRYMMILYCLFTSVAQTINSVPNTYSNIFVKNYEYRIYS